MTEHTGELCLSRKNSRALPRYVTPNWSPWQTNREVHKRIKKLPAALFVLPRPLLSDIYLYPHCQLVT